MFLNVLASFGLLAQFPRNAGPSGAEVGTAIMMALICNLIIVLVITVPIIAGMWKVFVKAGEPGWAAIVPIYNAMVLAKIGGRDPMYGLLLLVPVVGIVFAIIILLDVAKKFDVGGGFVAGLILLPMIFWPILGFGSAQYRGGRSGGGRRSARSSRRDYDDDEEEDDRPRRRRRPRDEDDDY